MCWLGAVWDGRVGFIKRGVSCCRNVTFLMGKRIIGDLERGCNTACDVFAGKEAGHIRVFLSARCGGAADGDDLCIFGQGCKQSLNKRRQIAGMGKQRVGLTESSLTGFDRQELLCLF